MKVAVQLVAVAGAGCLSLFQEMVVKILVKKSKIHGVGVFANRAFNAGDIIEICPIILLSSSDRKKIDKTNLYNFYFSWKTKAAIGLGYSSLYNHSYAPNSKYVKIYASRTIRYSALKKIRRGEEITVNYNGNPLSLQKVWFHK